MASRCNTYAEIALKRFGRLPRPGRRHRAVDGGCGRLVAPPDSRPTEDAENLHLPQPAWPSRTACRTRSQSGGRQGRGSYPQLVDLGPPIHPRQSSAPIFSSRSGVRRCRGSLIVDLGPPLTGLMGSAEQGGLGPTFLLSLRVASAAPSPRLAEPKPIWRATRSRVFVPAGTCGLGPTSLSVRWPCLSPISFASVLPIATRSIGVKSFRSSFSACSPATIEETLTTRPIGLW